MARTADDLLRRMVVDIEAVPTVAALFGLLLGTPRHRHNAVPLQVIIASSSSRLC